MLLPNLTLSTKRLLLRPFTPEDIHPCYLMNLDPEVSQYTGDGGVVSKAEVQRRITVHVLGDYKKYGFGRLAVELKATRQFIGFAGLKYLEDLKEVDLGYRFIKAHWGNGYATEAAHAAVSFGFEKLELKKIIAMAFAQNTASVRVLEKLGFEYEKNIVEDGEQVGWYELKHENYEKIG